MQLSHVNCPSPLPPAPTSYIFDQRSSLCVSLSLRTTSSPPPVLSGLRMLSWQIRAVARRPLAVGPPSWPASRLLGLRLSAAVEITSSYQKSEITNPATWDGLAAFLISMLPDMGATHPSSGPHLRVKSSRPVTGVAGIEQRVPNPKSGGASWHSTQRGMCGYGYKNLGDPA